MKAISRYKDRSVKNTAPSDLALTRRTAWLLSLAGYIPFVALAGALWVWLPQSEHYVLAKTALQTYGAIILSFLGGVRWGLALRSASNTSARRDMIMSVVPSLIGWFSLYVGAPGVFAVQALAFAGVGAWDALSGEKGAFGLWFVRLRMVLTFLVTGALIAAFFATV
ncbi:MAG: DUF3429 family protein [Rhizobiaceae bacterium]|nr:DUF3429 family protein [Rhizobiaceae bacterium]